MKLEKDKEQILRDAKTHLMVAGTLVYNSASGTEPFRASKFLNILGKEIQQLAKELAVFLGYIDFPDDKMAWEITKQPSLRILEMLAKEK